MVHCLVGFSLVLALSQCQTEENTKRQWIHESVANRQAASTTMWRTCGRLLASLSWRPQVMDRQVKVDAFIRSLGVNT